jgi:hypothetical protein
MDPMMELQQLLHGTPAASTQHEPMDPMMELQQVLATTQHEPMDRVMEQQQPFSDVPAAASIQHELMVSPAVEPQNYDPFSDVPAAASTNPSAMSLQQQPFSDVLAAASTQHEPIDPTMELQQPFSDVPAAASTQHESMDPMMELQQLLGDPPAASTQHEPIDPMMELQQLLGDPPAASTPHTPMPRNLNRSWSLEAQKESWEVLSDVETVSEVEEGPIDSEGWVCPGDSYCDMHVDENGCMEDDDGAKLLDPIPEGVCIGDARKEILASEPIDLAGTGDEEGGGLAILPHGVLPGQVVSYGDGSTRCAQ